MDIENSTRGILTAFFRQGTAFLVMFVLIMAGGLSYLLLTKPIYEAKGSLVVKFGQETRIDPNVGEQVSQTEMDATARQEIIRSYIKIIFSQEMLRALVGEFGPLRLYPELKEISKKEGIPAGELAVQKLLDNDLKVNFDQSHIIEIAVHNPDPKVATDFAAQVMASFVRRRTEIYNTPQTDFLQRQIEEAQEKFQSAQQEFQNFKQEAGISSIDEEMAQLLREKSELNTLAYAAVTESQARLAELETQLARMQSTYRAESPMLTRFQNTVAVARSDLENRQRDLSGVNASGSSLGGRIANVDKRLSYLESHRGRYNALQQQLTINEGNYLYYLKRGEEARINNLLNRHNITRIGVVDRPVLPVEPIKPRKTIFLAVTLLAAIMAGGGVALSRELLDDRLVSPDQVYSILGVPVLTTFGKEM